MLLFFHCAAQNSVGAFFLCAVILVLLAVPCRPPKCYKIHAESTALHCIVSSLRHKPVTTMFATYSTNVGGSLLRQVMCQCCTLTSGGCMEDHLYSCGMASWARESHQDHVYCSVTQWSTVATGSALIQMRFTREFFTPTNVYPTPRYVWHSTLLVSTGLPMC